MKKTLFALTALLFCNLSCTSAPKWQDGLMEAEVPQFEKANASFQQFVACGEETAGNDAQYSAQCMDYFKNRELLVKIRSINASPTNTYEIVGDLANDSSVTCTLVDGKNDTNKLSSLKKGDNVKVSGRAMSYRKNYVKPNPYTKDIAMYSANLSPCEVHIIR